MGAAAVLFTAIGTPSTLGCLTRAASEQEGNNLYTIKDSEEIKDFKLKIKARSWPRSFYVGHVRPSHTRRGRWAAAVVLFTAIGTLSTLVCSPGAASGQGGNNLNKIEELKVTARFCCDWLECAIFVPATRGEGVPRQSVGGGKFIQKRQYWHLHF